jgi:rare lipoprotein A
MLMTGCGTTTSTGEHRSLIPLPWKHRPAAGQAVDPDLPKLPAAGSGRGGYYQDDGPGPNPPANLRQVPDAEVRYEPYARFANKPYSVFGQTYTPRLNEEPFNQRGIASWYGIKFHGARTSSGEAYDMYKMTAAHPTLPIPSYARVTSVATGKSVVVRINDRGPFHSDRVIDVSYTAALKLGLLGKGSHEVAIERLFPNDPARAATARRAATSQAQATTTDFASLMAGEAADADDQAAPSAIAKGQFYLQLGAFSKQGKAEEMSQRLAKNGLDTATIDLVQAGSVQRLYSGPFATRALALAAARALPSSLGLKPIVVKR